MGLRCGKDIGKDFMWQEAYDRGYAETYAKGGTPTFRWIDEVKKEK